MCHVKTNLLCYIALSVFMLLDRQWHEWILLIVYYWMNFDLKNQIFENKCTWWPLTWSLPVFRHSDLGKLLIYCALDIRDNKNLKFSFNTISGKFSQISANLPGLTILFEKMLLFFQCVSECMCVCVCVCVRARECVRESARMWVCAITR